MDDDTSTIEQPEGNDTSRPRRLLRSSSDRVLAGVAGGLGRHFGVDPVIFRIGFALSIFFGGLGALAYLVLAVVVPTDGDPDRAQRIGERLRSMGFWRALGMLVVAALALGGLFALAGGAAFAVAIGWGVPVGIGVIATGVLLCIAAFRGGARWVIPPLLALVIGGSVAAAADLDLRGGIGERQHHPLSVSSIPAKGYKLGVGRLAVDLRDLDWNKAQVVHLKVELGAGQADVFVPERVCVAGSTHVGVGESIVAGERNDGVDVDQTAGTGVGIPAGASAAPRLDIDANVEVGQLRVINSDSANASDAGDRINEDTGPQRAAEASACGTR
jgi:phage shock protein PspC (stress-responsive transcriptional regulator)